MQQTDVKAATVLEDGLAVEGRQRLKGVYFIAGASEGGVTLRDGSDEGEVRLDLTSPGSEADVYVPIPDQGILFQNGIHVSLVEVTSVTVFYG